MNELIEKYRGIICKCSKSEYDKIIEYSEMDQSELKNCCEEENSEAAMEKILKYGTYDECVKSLRSYIVYVQMKTLLEIFKTDNSVSL